MKKRALLLVLVPLVVSAADVKLMWDLPSSLTEIAGYQVLYGTATGNYTVTYNVSGGNTARTATITGLSEGTVYYFVARSRNSDATKFSAYSNEVSTSAGSLASPVRLRRSTN